MDLIFLLTNFFFVCFVVYQRILVRYLIFLSKLKYTRKLEVRVVSSLSESSFALAYIGIEMHIFMSLCSLRVTNLNSRKAPSIM